MITLIVLFSLLIVSLYGQPIAFTQISKITSWWPESNIAKSIGVPYYANTTYNYFSFQAWTCISGISSIPSVFARPLSIFGSNLLGSSDESIRQQLKRRYQSTGAKVILGVFSELEYPVRFGLSAMTCAQKLSEDVLKYEFDGVEINYQDGYTFETGTAEQWLIDFTRRLRELLPNHKMIHTVDSLFFRGSIYPKQGYIKINREVGEMIDFYNVKYFGGLNNSYSSYEDLFIKSLNPNERTSVRQLSQLGVNLNKIVVGKSAKIGVNGYVMPNVLNEWAMQAKNEIGWSTGYWMGDLADDHMSGDSIRTALAYLRSNNTSAVSNTTSTNFTSTTNQTNSTSTITTNITNNITTTNNNTLINSSNNPYPVYFAYVDRVTSWWGNQFVAGMGVPGYAPQTLPYNYYALSFWLSSGPADIALAWANAGVYFSFISNDTQQVQKKIRKAYNDAGKKILVSAFGSTQFPTTHGKDPITVANSLASFVLNNNLDGVDIDWEDNNAMQTGTGQEWLIKFQTQLRSLLPYHIISHAPQAPYFKSQYYKNGGYITVNNKVGNLIDFYNVQFYNQGDTKYDSYNELFLKATGFFSGTSVQELIDRGIPARKIVVGKPATVGDVMNTGYIAPQILGDYWSRFRVQKGVQCQLMIWQLVNDKQGMIGQTIITRGGRLSTTNTSTNGTTSNVNNTIPNGNITVNNNTSNSTNNSTNTNTNTTSNNNTNITTTSSLYTLSMFYCGFGKDFCGQSSTNDVSTKASFVLLAFANILNNGSIEVDRNNFPTNLQYSWKNSNKKVLLSVGGQNVDWDVAFTNTQNTNNFINSVYDAVTKYNLDGVDLNIETYKIPPRTVANMIISLKTKLTNNKLLTVTPQDVTVYQGVSVPSADAGGQAWNYMVPIIRLADAYIDYYQVQAYNNWYGSLPGGSVAYLKQVYLHWRNILGTIQWISPIPDFKGVDGNKLLIGVLASTTAGVPNYYAPPQVIKQFKGWLKANNYPLKGFMMWDSNWDKLNSFLISNAITDNNF